MQRLDVPSGFHQNSVSPFQLPLCHPMKLRLLSFLSAICLASPAMAGPRFLNCDYGGGHVSIVAADGSIEWQVDAKNPQDCWLLPNGNILFAYINGAKEMTK